MSPLTDVRINWLKFISKVLFNHYLCFFSNHNETAKQKQKTFGWIFSDFLSDVLLKISIIIKCQLDFIMGKNLIAQLSGCHDIHTADGKSVLKRTAIADVVYSTLTGIRINRGHYIKHCGKVYVRTIGYLELKMAGTSNDQIL